MKERRSEAAKQRSSEGAKERKSEGAKESNSLHTYNLESAISQIKNAVLTVCGWHHV